MATGSVPAFTKEAISKFHAQLNCAICLERYTDPRMLPCQHTYCKDCIFHLPVELENGIHIVKCPSCRESIQLGDQGASDLPAAFQINQFLEIDELLRKNVPQVCSEHNKLKELYCETCEELICIKCGFNNHRTLDHQYNLADELFEKHKEEIKGCLRSVDVRIDEVEQTLTAYDRREREIQDQCEAVKEEIDKAIELRRQEFMDELMQSRKALYDEAETATHLKLRLHTLERAEVETVLVQLKSCKEFVKEKLSSQSQHQIQSAKKGLVQHITDTHTKFEVSDLQPGQNANTTFLKTPPGYQYPEVGSVTATQNYQSVSGLVSVNIPESIPANQATEISIVPTISLPANSLSCKMDSRWLIEPLQSCRVFQVDEDHFKAILVPRHDGEHQLGVFISGIEINDSPFTVPVVPLADLREQGLKVFVEGLQHPYGIAVTDDGQHVVVTERDRHCVTVLSATGEVVRRFGRHGNGAGCFVHPTEVVISADNHIYVKDDDQIQKFTMVGQHKARFVRSPEANFSSGMAVLPNGNILTYSLDKRIIYEVTADLCEFNLFRIEGISKEPCSLAVDADGVINVVMQDLRIYKYTPQKKYIGSFISQVDRTHQLQGPMGICIDDSNTTCMYITDGRQVKIFASNGKYIGSFGNHRKLRGIAMSKNGDLFICKANGEILVSRIARN